MKNIIIRMALLCLILLSSNSVLAAVCVQTNNEIGLVGLDNPNGNVYSRSTTSGNECNCKNVRFKAVNTDTKMVLSILLSAKMAGKKVRIDLKDGTDCNSAYQVYIH